jgi:hypothetical protein
MTEHEKEQQLNRLRWGGYKIVDFQGNVINPPKFTIGKPVPFAETDEEKAKIAEMQKRAREMCLE